MLAVEMIFGYIGSQEMLLYEFHLKLLIWLIENFKLRMWHVTVTDRIHTDTKMRILCSQEVTIIICDACLFIENSQMPNQVIISFSLEVDEAWSG